MLANRQPKNQSRPSFVRRSPASDAITAPGFTKIALVFALALLIWLASGQILPKPVHAAGVVGTGTPASCTDAAFNAALAGGGLITFNCGPNPVTIDISPAAGGTGTKTISANTTIDGGGLITISGGNAVGVFDVSNSVTFFLQNISIVNGNAGSSSGGAISNNGGIVNITNSFINNNKAGIGTSFVGNGGAIYNFGGTLNISNSTFSGNQVGTADSAPSEGGAIFGGIVNITNSIFSNNRSTGLGSIISHSKFTIVGSRFVNNNGNSLINDDAITPYDASIQDSLFEGNSNNRNGSYPVIYNTGARIAIKNTIFKNNKTGSFGVIIGNGELNISNSSFINNSNESNGSGALTLYGGKHSISSSVFSGNVGSTGAIEINNETNVNIVNSTFSDNIGNTYATDIYITNKANANVVVVNSSFYKKTKEQYLINIGSSSFRISNSVILSNLSNPNCTGTIIDGGNNIQWPDNSCGATIPVKDPKLAPLAYNGGLTLTHALLPGSPAIDAGNNAVCAASPVNNLDQRGFTRVTIPGGADVGKNCDIGAYESPVFVGLPPAPTPATFDGTQPDASPILNNYPGLNFQPCFSFRDWTLPSTAPFRFVAGTNPKGYTVTGNRSAIVASNTGKFKCQVSLVSGTPPSATGSKPKPGTELEADAWSFEGSSPTAIRVDGVDAAGNIIQSQTIPANLNTGTTTKVTFDKPGIVAIIFNVDILTASAPCDLNNNEFYRFCIAVDNFSVTPITPTVVGSVTLLPGSTRVAFADDNGGTKLEAVTPSANNTLGLGAVSIQAGGTGNIPVNARGVVGVLTAIGCTKGGNMRFWTGSNVPDAVNLNIPGAFNPVPNLSTSFVAPLDSSGKVNLGLNAVPGTKCGYAVDVVGYFNYANFLPATTRIAFANGTTGTKLVATGATPANPPSTSSISIEAAGKNGIPSGAKGIMGVLTAIGCTGGGNLRLWAGANVPSTVNLNIAGAFKPVPNLSTSFTAPLDADGKIKLGLGAASGVSCGYAVDVVAYITDAVLLPEAVRVAFANTTGTLLKSNGATPANPPAGNSVAIKIGGVSGIPANAKGVIGVLTAIGCSGGGNLRFWAGTSVPNTVNLNIPGAFNPVPNLSTSFVAPLDSSGNVNLGLARLGPEIACGYAVDITGYIP